MARLVVKNGHSKNMCYDEIGLCAPNIHILGSIMYTIGRLHVITYISFASCVWSLNWQFACIIAIVRGMRQFLIWPTGQTFLELEVPTERPHTLLSSHKYHLVEKIYVMRIRRSGDLVAPVTVMRNSLPLNWGSSMWAKRLYHSC